jgi:serine/threonine-protein kinase
MVFGTPEFMSLERAQGMTLDRRSDLYSLAIILYEALTGKLPFDARTSMEYIQLHVTKPPIHIDKRIEGKTFPPGLGDVIARALEKEPDDRYDDATQFGDALKPYATAESLEAAIANGTASASSPETAKTSAQSKQAQAELSPASEANKPTAPGPAPAPLPNAALATEPEADGLSSRTLIIVSAVSVIAGIVLAVVALKLLG